MLAKKGKFFLFLGLWILFFAPSGLGGQQLTLPEVKGWLADPQDYLIYQSGLYKAFYVKRLYQQDDKRIELLLAGGPEGDRLKQALENRFQLETKDYYLRYQKLEGYRAFLSYHRPEKSGVIAIFLQEDPILILLARYKGLEDQKALEFLKTIDWKKLREKGLGLLRQDQR